MPTSKPPHPTVPKKEEATEQQEEATNVVQDRASIASIDLGRPMNCISIAVHPYTSLCAVGGAQSLKIVSLSPNGLAEKRHVRLATKATSQVNFTINDVDWNVNVASRNLLASGLSNGHIGIWDVSREGRAVPCQEFSAHSRAVNRINWHPEEDQVLISASQDMTIKLWDRRGRNFNCQVIFQPRSEAVRDVQFNPHQPHLFATACENGSLQVWDRRKQSMAVVRIMGHSGPLLALEWHSQDAYKLATGARDRTIKIWDTREQGREDVKEIHLINTISPVGRIRWRPGYPDHLAVTSSTPGDHSVSIWNVRHPYLPLATLDGHGDVCTSIQWVDTPCKPEHASDHGALSGSPGTTVGVGGSGDARRLRSNSGSIGGGGGSSSGNWGNLMSPFTNLLGGGSVEEGELEESRGMEEFSEYLGVWQHLVSCGRDGRVVLHSVARAQRPREWITPSVLAMSPRGELAACHEEIDRSDEFVGIVMDERVENAPGLFAEYRSAARLRAPSTEDDRWSSMGSSSSSAMMAQAITTAMTNTPSTVVPAPPPALHNLSMRGGGGGMLATPAHGMRVPGTSDARLSTTGLPSSSSSVLMPASRSLPTAMPPSTSATTTTAASSTGVALLGGSLLHPSSSAPSFPSTLEAQQGGGGVSGAALTTSGRDLAISPATSVSLRDAILHQQQLQQAFMHPPLWVPRCMHLFTWDDALLGTLPPIVDEDDVPLEPLAPVSYADLVSNLAAHYSLRPSAVLGKAPLHDDDDDEEDDEEGEHHHHQQQREAAAGEASPPPPAMTLARCRRVRARLCQRNAQVALSVCQMRQAHIWHVMSMLLGGPQWALELVREGEEQDEQEEEVGQEEEEGQVEEEEEGGDGGPLQHEGEEGGREGQEEGAEEGRGGPTEEGEQQPQEGRRSRTGSIVRRGDDGGGGSLTPPLLVLGAASSKKKKTTRRRRRKGERTPGGKGRSKGGGCLGSLRATVLTQVVEEMIEEGDVQNTVAICEVLSSTCGDLQGEQLSDLIKVDPSRLREVYLGYIEVLQRLELFQAANDLVAFTPEPFIQKLNMNTTSVYASCASCRRPINSLVTPGVPAKLQYCAKCRAVVSQCAMCQQPVRGIFVWCPGCSHGGHLAHMRDWFLTHRQCPTGCGHVCNLVLPPLNNTNGSTL